MLSDIHALIHSLSKTEKQYFQRHASQHVIGEKNHYLKLFDVLKSQNKLDEKRISVLFREQNLYMLKRHLQNSILKVLRSYHASSSAGIHIHTMIDEIEVLYKKGLIKSSLKILHHAKKFAKRHEQHLALLQLMEWEIRLLHVPHKVVQTRQKFLSIFREEDKQMDLFKNFRDASRFRLDIIAFHNQSIIVKKKDKTQHRSIEARIGQFSKKDLSVHAQWQLCNASGVYFSTVSDFSKSSLYFQKATELFRKNAFILQDEMHRYLFSLYLQSATSYNQKKFKDALRTLQILRETFVSLPEFSRKKNLLELYLYTLLLESMVRMELGSFREAFPVVARLNELMDIHISSVHGTLRSEFYYLQTIFWFCAGEYKKAQHYLNRILQDADAPKENPAHYCFARIMQLIVLLELSEFRQIENLLPATRKYLHRKSQHYKMENAILDFISEYSRSRGLLTEKQNKELLIAVKGKLLKIAKDPNEAKALNVFDYISWLECKMQNMSFREWKEKMAEQLDQRL